jgi:hypothetical protein
MHIDDIHHVLVVGTGTMGQKSGCNARVLAMR